MPQAQLLGISRGTAYYNPKPIAEAKLALMRSIHELHLAHQIHLSQTAVCSNERSRLCTRVRQPYRLSGKRGKNDGADAAANCSGPTSQHALRADQES